MTARAEGDVAVDGRPAIIVGVISAAIASDAASLANFSIVAK
jgi:hypothetical protein